MKTITINVTQKDIDEGVRCSFSSCPIAHAVRRSSLVKHVNKPILVDNRSMKIGDTVYTLPKAAREFIYNFDDNDEVTPFRFRTRKMTTTERIKRFA